MSKIESPELNQSIFKKGSKDKLTPLQKEIAGIIEHEIDFESVEKCLCGGEDFVVICDGDRYLFNFKMLMCSRCGLLFTDPVLAESTIKRYYDKCYHGLLTNSTSYDEKESLFGHEQGKKVFNRIVNFLDGHEISVLEIGFGSGNILREVKSLWEEGQDQNKCYLYGTEFSQVLCRKGMSQGIRVLHGGAKEAAQFNLKFDVIILSHVLEHVRDLSTFIQQIKDVSHKRTIIYIEIPGVFDLHNKPEYSMDLEKYFIHSHIYHFNRATLLHYMAQYGLICFDSSEIAYGVFSPGKPLIPSLEGNAALTKNYLQIETFLRDDIYSKYEITQDLKKQLQVKSAEVRSLNQTIEHLKAESQSLNQRIEELTISHGRLEGNILKTTEYLKEISSFGKMESAR